MKPACNKKLTTLFFAVLLFFSNPAKAFSGCTVSVNINEAQPNSSANRFTFALKNETAGLLKWFKITDPFAGLTTTSTNVSGWTADYTTDANSTTLTGNNLYPDAILSADLLVNIDDIGGSSGTWAIQASSDSGGASPINCDATGSLALAITGQAADTTPPIVSGITVSGTTSSQTTISWTTNEAANSEVQYGLESTTYSLTKSDSSLLVNHSLTITSGIAAGTTYYYRICSSDASGNQTCSGENNFTTSAATATTTTTTATATPTATATVTTTSASTTTRATATPFLDRIDPVVKFTTDLSDSFEEAPLIEGTAEDASSTLGNIEYSIDGGFNWLPVDDYSAVDGSLKSVAFSFTPNLSEDGNYSIIARAADSYGNTGESEEQTLIIDRLPPRVGGNLLYLGPHPLLPNENGVIVTMAGLAQKITLSAVGGPTYIDLLANERMFSLAHSTETGLWTGSIIFKTSGIYQLKTKAVDGAGNETQRELNTVLVMRSGQITSEDVSPITEGKIKVYYQDPTTESWTLWEGKSFGQENPQNIDENGNYEFFLPKGTYYLEVSSPGYTTLTTKIFKINEATPFNADFTLQKAKGIKIGPFLFAIPRIFIEQADVVIKSPSIPDSVVRSLVVGEELPRISLPTQTSEFDSRELRGDNSVLIFISSWSPPAVEQISTLDDAIYNRRINAQFITTQETPSKISIFLKRGNYFSEIAVDRDGEITEEFNINSLPTHFFINRTGVVEKVVTGVLNEEEVKNIISQIN